MGLLEMAERKLTWKDVKAILADKDKSELLKLISDLYSLDKGNKIFIHTRYLNGEGIPEYYRTIISEALYPDVYKNGKIRFSVGKKAISDYYKATNDKMGQLELMIHYVHMGTKFTAEYGDMDENFYTGLESMFKRIIDELLKRPGDSCNQYIAELEDIVLLAGEIGWGYQITISNILENYQDIARRWNK